MITTNNIAKFAKTLLTGTVSALIALTVVGGIAANNGSQNTVSGRATSNELSAVAAPNSALLVRPNYARFADNLRHWDKATVNVYVDPSGDDMKDPSEVLASVKNGLGLWNNKLSAAIKLQVTDNADNADITVAFVAPGSLAGGAIGRTDVTFRLDDQILTHAAVRINRDLPASELVQVSAHELGHALGIQGHSPDKRDLMYAYAHLPAEVTDRDLNTMAIPYKASLTASTPSTPVAMNTRTASNTGRATETDSAAEFAAVAGK